MATKVLIDTNILVYAIDSRSDFHLKSNNLLSDSNNDLEIYIADKTIYELTAVLTSKAYSKIVDQKTLKSNLSFFLDNPDFQILYSNQEIQRTSIDIILKPRTQDRKIYDMVLAATAIYYDIDYIYTKNLKDFKNLAGVKAIDPT